MFSRSRMICVVFYVTAVLIGTVYLRTASSKVFHQARQGQVEQRQLVEILRKKQLELDGLVNPAAISEQIVPKEPEAKKE